MFFLDKRLYNFYFKYTFVLRVRYKFQTLHQPSVILSRTNVFFFFLCLSNWEIVNRYTDKSKRHKYLLSNRKGHIISQRDLTLFSTVKTIYLYILWNRYFSVGVVRIFWIRLTQIIRPTYTWTIVHEKLYYSRRVVYWLPSSMFI